MPTLYRKYRPQNFAEVVGQEIIVRTLKNALEADTPAHSYLFTGPRGTGKTSLARIFAKVLNCQNRKGAEACGKCAHCLAIANEQSLDIIEIDAASYTGVDNIRSLRETMTNAPLLGRYKIYIIDEVHMLSLGAFNALLKIMEEPPAHVVFLLATTELHKVPKTILSRTQRFDLRKLTLSEITGKLKTISKKEGIKIDPEALVLIAKNSGGALRDAESLLTQMATVAQGVITTDLVETSLGVGRSENLYQILRYYCQGNIEGVLTEIKALEDGGKDPSPITRDLLEILRHVLLYKARKRFDVDPLSLLTDSEQESVIFLAERLSYQQVTNLLEALEEALVKMKNSTFGFLPLEIAFVQNMPESPQDSQNPPTGGSSSTPPKRAKSEEEISESDNKERPENQETEAKAENALENKSEAVVDIQTIETNWRAIIEKVKLLNASLSVALQSARPAAIEENTLHIAVKYKFHQERLNEPAHQLTLQEAFDTILGTHLAFRIVEETAEAPKKPREASDPLVQHALELLGGSVI